MVSNFPSKDEYFLNQLIWSTEGTLTLTTILSQSGFGSNGKEEYSTLPRSLELELHSQMYFSEISRAPPPFFFSLFFFFFFCRGYSQHILSYTNRVFVVTCFQPRTRILLYTLPVNSNGYIPFFINTLDTIVRTSNFAEEVVTTSSKYLLYGVGEYCILWKL